MILLKDASGLQKMRVAGQKLSLLFATCVEKIVPGTTTAHLDAFVADFLSREDLVSQSKGYHGYQHVSCVSVNEVVVHGVPSDKVTLQIGDVVTLDVCAAWQGYCADMARTFVVGSKADIEATGCKERIARFEVAHRMIWVGTAALDAGIAHVLPLGRLGDVSAAIQAVIEAGGFGVVRDFAGHGIGRSMHEDPEILNYGKPGKGPIIRPGMAFAIEPMLTAGSEQIVIEQDGWTARTRDRSLAVHVEDTVIVTDNGSEVVTRQR